MKRGQPQHSQTLISFVQCLFVAVMTLAISSHAFGQSRSPSPTPTPPPQTPEQKFNSARSRFAQSQQLVKTTWTAVKQSRERLGKSHEAYAQVMDQLRQENAEDPLLQAAGAQIIESRAALEVQRQRALSELRLNFSFNRLQSQQRETAQRLDELMKARQRASEKRLPFDPQLQAEIGQLSLSVLKLNDDVATMEDELLDNHEGYQEASQAMDQALEEAAQAVQTSRELREGNPRRQAAIKDLQTALAQAAASGKAYAEARRQRQQAAVALALSQKELEAARRR